jgi:hypothetical protein
VLDACDHNHIRWLGKNETFQIAFKRGADRVCAG